MTTKTKAPVEKSEAIPVGTQKATKKGKKATKKSSATRAKGFTLKQVEKNTPTEVIAAYDKLPEGLEEFAEIRPFNDKKGAQDAFHAWRIACAIVHAGHKSFTLKQFNDVVLGVTKFNLNDIKKIEIPSRQGLHRIAKRATKELIKRKDGTIIDSFAFGGQLLMKDNKIYIGSGKFYVTSGIKYPPVTKDELEESCKWMLRKF